MGQVPGVRELRRGVLWRWLAIALGAGLIILSTWGPGGLFNDARWVGYAVCHQIPDRSYWALGHPLPLCARCTGQYLGALVMLGYILWTGRTRAARWPSRSILAVLGLFFVLWGFDGLNSYLTLLGLPHLYEPHNWLRLVTGSLQGIVLMTAFWPLFAAGTWSRLSPGSVLTSWGDLFRVLGAMFLLVLLVHAGGDRVRYALGLVSTGGVLLLLSLVNSLFVRILFRREGSADTGWSVGGGILLGFLLALLEIWAMGALRTWLVGDLGVGSSGGV